MASAVHGRFAFALVLTAATLARGEEDKQVGAFTRLDKDLWFIGDEPDNVAKTSGCMRKREKAEWAMRVAAGDLTGDGIDDLTILLDDEDTGRVQVQAGSTTEFDAAPTEVTTSATPVFTSGGVAEMSNRAEPVLMLSAPADGVWVYQLPGF